MSESSPEGVKAAILRTAEEIDAIRPTYVAEYLTKHAGPKASFRQKLLHSCAVSPTVSDAAFRQLFVCLSFANENGSSLTAGNARIAALLGCGVRTVTNGYRELERMGASVSRRIRNAPSARSFIMPDQMARLLAGIQDAKNRETQNPSLENLSEEQKLAVLAPERQDPALLSDPERQSFAHNLLEEEEEEESETSGIVLNSEGEETADAPQETTGRDRIPGALWQPNEAITHEMIVLHSQILAKFANSDDPRASLARILAHAARSNRCTILQAQEAADIALGKTLADCRTSPVQYLPRVLDTEIERIVKRDRDRGVDASKSEAMASAEIQSAKDAASAIADRRIKAFDDSLAARKTSAAGNGDAATRFPDGEKHICDVHGVWISGFAANRILDSVPEATMKDVRGALLDASSESVTRLGGSRTDSGAINKPPLAEIIEWTTKRTHVNVKIRKYGPPEKWCDGPIGRIDMFDLKSTFVHIDMKFIAEMKKKYPLANLTHRSGNSRNPDLYVEFFKLSNNEDGIPYEKLNGWVKQGLEKRIAEMHEKKAEENKRRERRVNFPLTAVA